MVAFDNSVRIVRSWPGPGTTETIYEDERGVVWRENRFPSSGGTTCVERGYVDGDRIRRFYE